MEWVETTAKTLDGAREAALDQLGVGADDAEFDVIEEPKPGLFGRTRGQARLRARVKPTPVRPKQERKRRSKSDKPRGDGSQTSSSQGAKAQRGGENSDAPAKKQRNPKPAAAQRASAPKDAPATDQSDESVNAEAPESGASSSGDQSRSNRGRDSQRRQGERSSNNNQENKMSNEDRPESTVSPQEVGDAAVAFMDELVTAFGSTGTSELSVDGIELDVQVRGDDLGLLVGPGGRTLNAVQDLVRVAAQRRLGDHETRLRIDIAGYRERRTAALAKFAADVAAQVRESGSARSLEPMTSADRKVIHDALNEEDGVASSSSGEDPNRRVVVEPV